MDWLSRLFEMMPVRGRVDLRCLYGAPWRIEQGPAEVGEIPITLLSADRRYWMIPPAAGRSS
jgi:AraC family transcriptional regulator, activator of mtrCDE